jgi:hypothetical protein
MGFEESMGTKVISGTHCYATMGTEAFNSTMETEVLL